MPDGVLGPIAVRGRIAIVPVRNGQIVALELSADGDKPSVLWETTARDGARVLAGCSLTETHVYAITHDGFLIVMGAKTGMAFVEARAGTEAAIVPVDDSGGTKVLLSSGLEGRYTPGT